MEGVPGDFGARAAAIGDDVHVIEYGDSGADFAPWFDVLGREPGFTLWRFRVERVEEREEERE